MNIHKRNLIKKVVLNKSKSLKNLEFEKHNDGTVSFINSSNENQTINIGKVFSYIVKNRIFQLVNNGVLKRGECYFECDYKIIPLNATAEFPLSHFETKRIYLTLKPNTELTITELTYSIISQSKLDDVVTLADTLVISPGYPSSANLYSFGFVHTSCDAFIKAGLNIDVFTPSSSICSSKNQHKFDRSRIFCNSLVFLKNLIARSNYKRIIIHFIDERFIDIIDSVALYYGIKLYVYVHGAEVLYNAPEIMLTGYDGICRQYLTSDQIIARDELLKNLHLILI